MAIVSAALRAKMGSTEYYISKMIVRELLQGVSPADSHQEWWNDLPADERMQRDANLKRVKEQIAPYLANSPDRFFGSLIVLVYEGDIEFESVQDFKMNIPKAYKNQAEDMGFITIDGGKLLVLDGQHRWYGLRSVMQGDTLGTEAAKVPTDEISVIFIRHENKEKTRRIFNKVNRYAKATNKGDNILTSEDDGYAIVTRKVTYNESGPFFSEGKLVDDKLVNWKSNTLSPRSSNLTTLSALYEMTQIILTTDNRFAYFGEKDTINRPAEELIDEATDIVTEFWNKLLDDFKPYEGIIERIGPTAADRRKDSYEYSLLYKPAGQIAFVLGLVNAMKRGLSEDELIERANQLSWSTSDTHWLNIIMTPNKSIIASPDAKAKASALITYLLAWDKFTKAELKEVHRMYNAAHGIDVDVVKDVEKQFALPAGFGTTNQK
jgi:DNA sulfur modification protein DndB